MKRADLVPLTYTDFGGLLDRLTARVTAHCEATRTRYDLVAPILRSGAFTGMHLASRLGTVQTLPLQYKYQAGGEIVRVFPPPTLDIPPPPRPTILLVDTNTVHGRIAQRALDDLRLRFPDAIIDFASAVMDQGCPPIEGARATFFGTRSNEARRLSREEADARSITNAVFVFPWETAEEQWNEIERSR